MHATQNNAIRILVQVCDERQKTFSNKIYMRYLLLFLTVTSDFKLIMFLLTHYCLEVKMHDVNVLYCIVL